MFNDRYDLPLSTMSPTAADAFVEGVDLMLSNNPDPAARFRDAIEADEGFAMAHVALGMQLQLRMDGPGAKVELDRARDLMPGASEREQSFINAVALPGFVGRGGPMEGLPLLEQHLDDFRETTWLPTATRRLSSSAASLKPVNGLATRWRGSNRFCSDDWAFLGGYSFILEEHAEYRRAQRFSERSLELYPRNAGAAHVDLARQLREQPARGRQRLVARTG